jgi:hypothetical protein
MHSAKFLSVLLVWLRVIVLLSAVQTDMYVPSVSVTESQVGHFTVQVASEVFVLWIFF